MSAYGNHVAASDVSSDVMVKGDMQCRLDTVTYTSPEFNELETVVEVCEPLSEADMPVPAPVEQGPEQVICISPEFDEIETLM